MEHYFDIERTAANREWFAGIQRDGIRLKEVKLRPPLPFLEEYLDRRAVEALPRWEDTVVDHWLRPPDEKWNEVQLATVMSLQFCAPSDEELRRDLAKLLHRIASSTGTSRKSLNPYLHLPGYLKKALRMEFAYGSILYPCRTTPLYCRC